MGRANLLKSDNALVRYFRDTRAEISKVSWPTREEGLRMTWVVSIVTVVAAVILFGIDSLFSLLVTLIVGAF